VKILIITILIIQTLLLGGCASSTSKKNSPVKTANPADVAKELQMQGNYLQSTYYLEAAIKTTNDEIKYLPLLIEAQIRSRRLLASLYSLKRLNTLQPGNKPAIDLYETVKKTIGLNTIER